MQDDTDAVDIILRRRRIRTPMRSNILVRAWLDEGRRLVHGHCYGLMPELRYEDPISYQLPPNENKTPSAMCERRERAVHT